MQGRLSLVFGVSCVLFVVLIARLMYIEYKDGKRYEKIVLSQLEYDSTTLPYKRGDIEDSKGTVLATSVDVYNVILDAKVLNANEDKIDSTIQAVTDCFPEIEADKIRKTLSDHPKSQYTILAKKVSYQEMADFLTRKEDEDHKGTITGIWFEKEYERIYPYNSLAAALIGFVSSGNNGVLGLENQYNDTLNGVNGRSYGYLNDDSDLEQTVIEPENGKTLITSIDTNIQSIVENEIKAFNKAYSSDGKRGSLNTAVLVMNPNNGEIYAMATYPTFDLNNPRDLSVLFTPEEMDTIDADAQMDALNGLWQNFTVTHTYEPGSTFKPFTVATGLETGTLTGEETFVCDGLERISGFEIHCVNRNGHGIETVAGSLMDSCNDALMQMSYRIGGDNFATYQRLFGFGQKTNVDVPGEARTDTLIYSQADLGKTVNLATNSFGQNFNTTMIQLASAFSSLINGGNLYQPHVVKKIQDDAGNVIRDVTPVVEKKTISADVSKQMKEYLEMVVEEGTGKTAGVLGYDIGGKTGTAQKVPRSAGNYLVSFIGYVPQDSPQLLIYCVVDTPNTPDQAHSSYAQCIVHNVLVQILPYLNIPTIEESEDSKKNAAILDYVTMQPTTNEMSTFMHSSVVVEDEYGEVGVGAAPGEGTETEDVPAAEQPTTEPNPAEGQTTETPAEPPAEQPPEEQPPTEQPPAEQPPEQPPAEQPTEDGAGDTTDTQEEETAQ
ncbi:MAG: penicillin-binding protein 2 [Lachnospiraceae bacterium]|nr:penicillin-binding protein 2 [Lachnospiraceae bacterium]